MCRATVARRSKVIKTNIKTKKRKESPRNTYSWWNENRAAELVYARAIGTTSLHALWSPSLAFLVCFPSAAALAMASSFMYKSPIASSCNPSFPLHS